MAVKDDMRRLSQMGAIFLGVANSGSVFITWYKGRLEQSMTGDWIFRSAGSDGSVVGFNLGDPTDEWTSSETPALGTTVTFPIHLRTDAAGLTPYMFGMIQQQLPRDDLA